MSTNSYNDHPVLRDELVVEVDFSKIEEEVNLKLDFFKMLSETESNKTRYCAEHDFYSLPNVPCFYCEKDRVREEQKKHWPKQKNVSCVDCGDRHWTYWGSKPYTCKTCLPNEQHLENVAEFMRELNL